ncbi:MAG: hypothetical protein R3C17_10265 [Planctomycetaceae bacterium]
MKIVLIEALLLAVAACNHQILLAGGEPASWSDIEAKWQQKIKAMPRMRVSYSQTTFMAAHTMSRSVMKDGMPTGFVVHDRDVELKSNATLAIDPREWRLEIDGELWDTGFPSGVVRRNWVQAYSFDDEQTLSYQVTEGPPSFLTRLGWIDNSAIADLQAELVPWSLLYWPLLEHVGLADPKVWVPDGGLVRVEAEGGAKLFRQTLRSKSDATRFQKFTINANIDWNVVSYDNGAVQWEIGYVRHGDEGWLPSKWTSTFRKSDDSGIAEECRGVVNNIQTGDSVHDSEFATIFPPGTVVRDQSGVSIFVRADGTRRIITDGELQSGVTYDQLESTTSGELDLIQRNASANMETSWPIYLVSSALLFYFVFRVANYFIRKHRSAAE